MLTKLAVFAAGLLCGTAGVKILASKDAKKVYSHTTAAVLRAKDSVMETVTLIRENADDVLAEAKAINAARAAEEEGTVVEDCGSGKDECRCAAEDCVCEAEAGAEEEADADGKTE